jgi:hypothetical protein
MEEHIVRCFPGITDAGGLTIGDRNGMDGVGVLVIEDKQIVVAST